MSKPILHAEFLKAYADGQSVEYKYVDSARCSSWTEISHGNGIGLFDSADLELRIKPKTILINGIEVPEPFRGELHLDQDYFIVKLHGSKKADPFMNGNPELGMRHVATGLVHLTEEAAETHARALLSFTAKDE